MRHAVMFVLSWLPALLVSQIHVYKPVPASSQYLSRPHWCGEHCKVSVVPNLFGHRRARPQGIDCDCTRGRNFLVQNFLVQNLDV